MGNEQLKGSDLKTPEQGHATPHKNYEGVQALRFFAAFLVLINHSTFYASERLLPGVGFWQQGATGVNIFFVISGFVMVVSTITLRGRTDGWRIFALHRISRIVPLYWAATSFKLAVFILLPSAILHSQFDIFHIVSSYFFIPTVNADGEFKPFLAVGWTLYFEMFFYGLFALALYLRCNLYFFLGTVLLVFASLSMYRTQAVAATMFFDAIVLQFFFGMLVARTSLQADALKKVTVRFPIVPALLSLVGTALLLAPFEVPGLAEAFRTGVPATMIVLGVVLLEPHLKGRLPKSLLLLGDASYAIYLFHPLIAPAIPTILRKLDILNYSLSIILSGSVAILFGTLIHVYFEKPLTQLLRSKKMRPVTPRRNIVHGTVRTDGRTGDVSSVVRGPKVTADFRKMAD
jgi:peptidoglycan/LPS O-acetylase OafA/YrhL